MGSSVAGDSVMSQTAEFAGYNPDFRCHVAIGPGEICDEPAAFIGDGISGDDYPVCGNVYHRAHAETMVEGGLRQLPTELEMRAIWGGDK
jgi:hypothetical protein